MFQWESFRSKSIESDILNFRIELFHRKKFTDVTLVSDELVKFPAHRTVLASASKLFDSLLEINTEQFPVLFLKGVPQNILEAILKFVYIGETSVRADQVAEFSEISKDLGISLSFNLNQHKEEQVIEEKTQEYSDKKMNFLVTSDNLIAEEKNIFNVESGAISPENQNQNSDVSNIFSEVNDHGLNFLFTDKDTMINDTSIQNSIEDVDVEPLEDEENETENEKLIDTSVSLEPEKVTQLEKRKIGETVEKNNKVRKVEDPAECNICARVFTTLRSMQRHHKTVHQGFLHEVKCPDCDKMCRGTDNLYSHRRNNHVDHTVTCDKCGVTRKSKQALINHKERHHPLPKCLSCNITFENETKINEHIQKEHLQKYC